MKGLPPRPTPERDRGRGTEPARAARRWGSARLRAGPGCGALGCVHLRAGPGKGLTWTPSSGKGLPSDPPRTGPAGATQGGVRLKELSWRPHARGPRAGPEDGGGGGASSRAPQHVGAAPALLPPDAGGAAGRGGAHARHRQQSAEAPRPLVETVARWRPERPTPRPAPCQSVMERPPRAAAAGAARRGARGPG